MAAFASQLAKRPRSLAGTAAAPLTAEERENKAKWEAQERARLKLIQLKKQEEDFQRAQAAKTEARQRAAAMERYNGPSASPSRPTERKPAETSREQKRRKAIEALFKDDDEPRPSRKASPAVSSIMRKAKSASPAPLLVHRKASASARGKKGLPDTAELVQLNTNKRDTRTIEEVERDMRARRAQSQTVQPRSASEFFASSSQPKYEPAVTAAPAAGSSKSHASSSKPKESAPPSKKRAMTDEPPREAKRAKRLDEDRPKTSKSKATAKTKAGPPKAPAASRAQAFDEPSIGESLRQVIWSTVGPRSRSYNDYYSDEDDLSDMEAGAADVWEEEQRAARLSAKEDREELERERRRQAEKKARKAAGLL